MRIKKKKGRGESYKQIIGKDFYIPADFFHINVPGMFYKFRVIKKDAAHKDAMTVVSLEDDGPKHWIPISLIHEWMECNDLDNTCTNEETDGYAVESLLYMKNCTEALSEEAAAMISLLSMQVKSNRLHHSRHEKSPVKCNLANSHGFFKFQSSGRFQVHMERDESEDMFKSVIVFEK